MTVLLFLGCCAVSFAIGIWVRGGECKALRAESAGARKYASELYEELQSWKRSFWDVERALDDAHAARARAATVTRLPIRPRNDGGTPPGAA